MGGLIVRKAPSKTIEHCLVVVISRSAAPAVALPVGLPAFEVRRAEKAKDSPIPPVAFAVQAASPTYVYRVAFAVETFSSVLLTVPDAPASVAAFRADVDLDIPETSRSSLRSVATTVHSAAPVAVPVAATRHTFCSLLPGLQHGVHRLLLEEVLLLMVRLPIVGCLLLLMVRLLMVCLLLVFLLLLLLPGCCWCFCFRFCYKCYCCFCHSLFAQLGVTPLKGR
eukprot:TRINITY_DN19177_c0_g1_i1.p1 TRINITY_DN19177_c0_g1~~TRINITY_DN19177_c0_g1_i1.p1  ORF type:complete len:224 (-),score=14.69 TRINITY_DN19177_c0_g1_i1:79-750(-)